MITIGQQFTVSSASLPKLIFILGKNIMCTDALREVDYYGSLSYHNEDPSCLYPKYYYDAGNRTCVKSCKAHMMTVVECQQFCLGKKQLQYLITQVCGINE